MSTGVGPAGRTRFSRRMCGRPFAMSYTGRFHRQTVPLCSFSSDSAGIRPASSSAIGSTSSVTGIRPGK
jgi:hypothetical protein